MMVAAEIGEAYGKQALSITATCADGSAKRVDLRLPASAEDVETVCAALMTNLAGVSQAELVSAGMMALARA